MDNKFAKKHQIKQIPLKKPIPVYNMDGTRNKVGKILHYAWIKTRIGQRQMDTRVLITGLGKEELIFGLPWLKQYNPKIDWEKGQMDLGRFEKPRRFLEVFWKTLELSQTQIPKTVIPTTIKQSLTPQIEEIFEEYPGEKPWNLPLEDWQPILELADGSDEEDLDLLRTYIEEDAIFIQAKISKLQELAQEVEKDKPKTVLPEFYEEYTSVFDKDTSEQMPGRRPWDHAIDLKEDFIPKDSKIYPISPKEQEKLDEFIDENLRK